MKNISFFPVDPHPFFTSTPSIFSEKRGGLTPINIL